jgi:hypothetical protein
MELFLGGRGLSAIPTTAERGVFHIYGARQFLKFTVVWRTDTSRFAR